MISWLLVILVATEELELPQVIIYGERQLKLQVWIPRIGLIDSPYVTRNVTYRLGEERSLRVPHFGSRTHQVEGRLMVGVTELTLSAVYSRVVTNLNLYFDKHRTKWGLSSYIGVKQASTYADIYRLPSNRGRFVKVRTRYPVSSNITLWGDYNRFIDNGYGAQLKLGIKYGMRIQDMRFVFMCELADKEFVANILPCYTLKFGMTSLRMGLPVAVTAHHIFVTPYLQFITNAIGKLAITAVPRYGMLTNSDAIPENPFHRDVPHLSRRYDVTASWWISTIELGASLVRNYPGFKIDSLNYKWCDTSLTMVYLKLYNLQVEWYLTNPQHIPNIRINFNYTTRYGDISVQASNYRGNPLIDIGYRYESKIIPNLSIMVEVENLLDRSYSIWHGLNEPRRRVSVGVGVKF